MAPKQHQHQQQKPSLSRLRDVVSIPTPEVPSSRPAQQMPPPPRPVQRPSPPSRSTQRMPSLPHLWDVVSPPTPLPHLPHQALPAPAPALLPPSTGSFMAVNVGGFTPVHVGGFTSLNFPSTPGMPSSERAQQPPPPSGSAQKWQPPSGSAQKWQPSSGPAQKPSSSNQSSSSSSSSLPPPEEVPTSIRSLFEFCKLAMSGIEMYMWLAAVLATAEETGDKSHNEYQDFMLNNATTLKHVKRCIQALNKVSRVELDKQYGTIRSYKALITCASRLPDLLDLLQNHWEGLVLIGGRVLTSRRLTSVDGAAVIEKLTEIKETWDSWDDLWKDCVDDIMYGILDSAKR